MISVVSGGACSGASALAAPLCQRPPGDAYDFVDIEGLRQVLECAALIGSHRAVEIGMSGGDDYGQIGVALTDAREQLQPVDARHADVADDRVGSFLAKAAAQ